MPPNFCLYLHQMSTDFKNSFTDILCGKFAVTHELTAAIANFTDINVSQGSVATLFRCGGIINNHFITNFLQSVPVKEFLKSVNIWRR